MSKRIIINFEKVNLHYGLSAKRLISKLFNKLYKKLINTCLGLISKLFNKLFKKEIKTFQKLISKKEIKTFHALNDINLEIYEGELVALIGSSGAGKTTILKAISGEETISSGTLSMYGKDISKLSEDMIKKIKKKTGIIFQDYDLISGQKVVRNVLNSKVSEKDLLSRIFASFSDSEKKAAYQKLEDLNMLNEANKKAFELSGGQKQRVAIARALLQNPSILLADEPVAALDPNMAKNVMDLMRKENLKNGITTIINLHHITLAVKYADRIVGVNKGKVVFNGTPKQLTLDKLNEIYGTKIKSISKNDLIGYQKENEEIRKQYEK